jgi:hypothetical protein
MISLSFYLIPASCQSLALLFLILKIEAKCSSETSVNFQGTTRRYITEDSTHHNIRCENLKSCILLLVVFSFAINPIWTALGMKPDLHSQMLASNGLSYVAVIHLTNICKLIPAFESISALVTGDITKSLCSSNFMKNISMLRLWQLQPSSSVLLQFAFLLTWGTLGISPVAQILAFRYLWTAQSA